jgi:hypothetical protein
MPIYIQLDLDLGLNAGRYVAILILPILLVLELRRGVELFSSMT